MLDLWNSIDMPNAVCYYYPGAMVIVVSVMLKSAAFCPAVKSTCSREQHITAPRAAVRRSHLQIPTRPTTGIDDERCHPDKTRSIGGLKNTQPGLFCSISPPAILFFLASPHLAQNGRLQPH